MRRLDECPEPVAQLLRFGFSPSRQSLANFICASERASDGQACTLAPHVCGSLPIPLCQVQRCQIVEPAGNFGMIWSQRILTDGKRTFVKVLGFGKTTTQAIEIGDVIEQIS